MMRRIFFIANNKFYQNVASSQSMNRARTLITSVTKAAPIITKTVGGVTAAVTIADQYKAYSNKEATATQFFLHSGAAAMACATGFMSNSVFIALFSEMSQKAIMARYLMCEKTEKTLSQNKDAPAHCSKDDCIDLLNTMVGSRTTTLGAAGLIGVGPSLGITLLTGGISLAYSATVSDARKEVSKVGGELIEYAQSNAPHFMSGLADYCEQYAIRGDMEINVLNYDQLKDKIEL